jgi:hypothetical protein
MVEGWVPQSSRESVSRYAGLHWFSLHKRQPRKISSVRDLLYMDLATGKIADYDSPREGIPVVTMRCVRCGYLESYARVKEAE